MGNNNRQQQNRGEQNAREFFTLGEHALGAKRYRFRYDGRTYLILEEQPEQEEKTLLEETESRTAYDAWNRIKRPERFKSE